MFLCACHSVVFNTALFVFIAWQTFYVIYDAQHRITN